MLAADEPAPVLLELAGAEEDRESIGYGDRFELRGETKIWTIRWSLCLAQITVRSQGIPPCHSMVLPYLSVDEAEHHFPVIDIPPIDVQVGLPSMDFFQVSAILQPPRHHLKDDQILERKHRHLQRAERNGASTFQCGLKIGRVRQKEIDHDFLI